MIYQRDLLSKNYFKLMLETALKGQLNCKDIAVEIIEFRRKLTGSNSIALGRALMNPHPRLPLNP